MPFSEQAIESRVRFVGKIVVAYAIYAAISAAFAWYMFHHNPGLRWAIGGAALLCLLGIFFLVWTLRAHGQRYRAQTRTFYSKLRSEFLPTGDEAAAPSEESDGAITASLGMYTRRETVGLTLLSICQKPGSALVVVVLSLVIGFSILFPFNEGWLSVSRVASALGIAIAFNGVIVTMSYIGMRLALKRVWKGSHFTIRISGRGVEISRGAESPSLVPWKSIDRVLETRSWILCMRNGRRIIALPISRIPQLSLDRLRRILRTAKGGSAELQSQ